MCVTALSLIFTVVVLNLHHHSSATTMSRCGLFLIFRVFARAVGLHREARRVMGPRPPKLVPKSKGEDAVATPMIPQDSEAGQEEEGGGGRGTTVCDESRSRPANGWASQDGEKAAGPAAAGPGAEGPGAVAEEGALRRAGDGNGAAWLLAARILDRVFLRVFFVVDVALLVAILCTSI